MELASGGTYSTADALYTYAGVGGVTGGEDLDGDGSTDFVAGIGPVYLFTELP